MKYKGCIYAKYPYFQHRTKHVWLTKLRICVQPVCNLIALFFCSVNVVGSILFLWWRLLQSSVFSRAFETRFLEFGSPSPLHDWSLSGSIYDATGKSLQRRWVETQRPWTRISAVRWNPPLLQIVSWAEEELKSQVVLSYRKLLELLLMARRKVLKTF